MSWQSDVDNVQRRIQELLSKVKKRELELSDLNRKLSYLKTKEGVFGQRMAGVPENRIKQKREKSIDKNLHNQSRFLIKRAHHYWKGLYNDVKSKRI